MERGTASIGDNRFKDEFALYEGRWVAQLGGRIVGQGGTPAQALQAAKRVRHKEIPKIMYIPTKTPFVYSPEFEQIRAALPQGIEIYLVGGAVRDAMLSRTVHDYDFVLASGALQVARRTANQLKAAYFALDEERQTARLILSNPGGDRTVADFSVFRGPDLENDLRARDFTINAMAVNIRDPQVLLDPLGGAADLWNKTLRACSSTSFQDDPVRILRAVRMAAGFDLHILPETRKAMGNAAAGLSRISPERLRDELIRILTGAKPHTALLALEMLNVLPHVLPELAELKNIPQSPPHIKDVWEHTLDTIRSLDLLLSVLDEQHDPDISSNLILGLVAVQLGRYRGRITSHIRTQFVPDRTVRAILFLAALLHDIAKPRTRETDEDGRIRFIDHENQGARIASQRGEALHLSNPEITRLKTIVKHHMRPTHLAREARDPSPRAVYRFFKDTGSAGVDICLLSLADLMATYGAILPQERWARQISIVRTLLDAWWEHSEEKVNPLAVISGKDLIAEFQLEPGPIIGELLEMIRESQVTGEVKNKKDALEFVREFLQKEQT